ncbi:hypothetical protein [Kitasatospora aureofaciens]|uniref:hypothetical protein n=1 Tax=Kitasatospora aureofaciens TaxID=1894 RepID=UPI00403E3F9D
MLAFQVYLAFPLAADTALGAGGTKATSGLFVLSAAVSVARQLDESRGVVDAVTDQGHRAAPILEAAHRGDLLPRQDLERTALRSSPAGWSGCSARSPDREARPYQDAATWVVGVVEAAEEEFGRGVADEVLGRGDGGEGDVGDVGDLVVVGDEGEVVGNGEAGAAGGGGQEGGLAVAEAQSGGAPGGAQVGQGAVGRGRGGYGDGGGVQRGLEALGEGGRVVLTITLPASPDLPPNPEAYEREETTSGHGLR